jgi:hypothetical protein
MCDVKICWKLYKKFKIKLTKKFTRGRRGEDKGNEQPQMSTDVCGATIDI